MFERPHHQRIERILRAFNSALLAETQCFFAGGTAIALQLDEFRNSDDIDFLCADGDGYRRLRNSVSEQSLGYLLSSDIALLRDVRMDQYGIRTFLKVDDTPIKLEIVREARIVLAGEMIDGLHVPVLGRNDLFTEKLLANADRGQDRSTASRDIIDLAIMSNHWGDIPNPAWDKARNAYGPQLDRAFAASCRLITNREYLDTCMKTLQMDSTLANPILDFAKMHGA